MTKQYILSCVIQLNKLFYMHIKEFSINPAEMKKYCNESLLRQYFITIL